MKIFYRKCFAWVLAFTMIFGLCGTAAAASDTSDVQAAAAAEDTSESAPSQDEDGTYLLSDADDLLWFAEQVNGGETSLNAKLTADIDLDGETWTPMGSSSASYVGTFDGAGYTISGLKSSSYGLFYYLGGTLKNLTLSDSTVSGSMMGSGLAGRAESGSLIINCGVTSGVTVSGTAMVGGISGNGQGTIVNCWSAAAVSGSMNYGGLVGYAPGALTNCIYVGTSQAYGTANNRTNVYVLAEEADYESGAYTAAEFSDGTVLALLNGFSTDEYTLYAWTADEKTGYPTLDYTTVLEESGDQGGSGGEETGDYTPIYTEGETVTVGDYTYYVAVADTEDANAEFELSAYTGSGGEITIENGEKYTVVAIRSRVFYQNKDITKVTLPDGLESIGVSAFNGAENLTEINIPDTVTEIDGLAFWKCVGLTSLTIPESVQTWGANAFGYCTGLTELILSDGLESVGTSAFYYCTSLTEVTVPSSVKTLGTSCFSYCTMLSCITLKEGLEEIGATAFAQTALTELAIPASVTSLGEGLCYSSSMSSYTVADGSGNYISTDGILYETDKDGSPVTLIAYPAAKTDTSYEIPSTVTRIGQSACRNTVYLVSVTVPDSVESMGDYAFRNGAVLAEVTLQSGLPEIGNYAFYNCSQLSAVTVPASVTQIGTLALGFMSDGSTVEGFAIYGYTGSQAQVYASSNGLTFVAIGEVESEVPEQDEDGYYILETEGQLLWFQEQVNGQNLTNMNARLGNDINLSAVCYEGVNWEPIGQSSGEPYTGTFDGCGYRITGLYGELSMGDNYYSLFGFVSGAVIRNLTVSGEIEGADVQDVGGIVAVCTSDSVIENCISRVNITITGNFTRYGGVIGRVSGSTVTGCVYEADMYTGTYTGGITGYAENTVFSECSNSGCVYDIYGTVGGIAGYALSSCVFTGCVNSGTVSGTYYSGGIAGVAADSEISDCSNTGGITGRSYNTGGIAGSVTQGSSVENCVNRGEVSGTSYTGGVAGFCAGTSTGEVSYCYNTGAVSGKNYVGGLVGTAGKNGKVSNSYNIGKVSCDGVCGGVSGGISEGSDENIANTYYKSSSAVYGVGGQNIDGAVSVKSLQVSGGELAVLLNTNDTNDTYRWIQDEDSLIPVLSEEDVTLPCKVSMYYQQSGSDPVFYGNVYTQADGTILLTNPRVDYFTVDAYYVMDNGSVTETVFDADTVVTGDMELCAVLVYSEGTVYEDEDIYQDTTEEEENIYADYETDVASFEAWTDHYGEWETQSDGSDIDTMVIYANLRFDEPVTLADGKTWEDLQEELSVRVGTWSAESSREYDVELSEDGCELSFTIYIGYAIYGGHLIIWPEDEDAGITSLVFQNSGEAVNVKTDLIVPNGLYTEITSVTVGTADTPASTTVKLIASDEENNHTTRAMIHMALLSNGESALGTLNIYGSNLTGHWHDYQNLTPEKYWALGYVSESTLSSYGYSVTFDGDEMTVTANEATEGEVLEFHIVSYLNNGTLELDKSELNSIIAAAEKVADDGSLDADAYAVFAEKLALAKAAQDSVYYSQSDIDTKAEELIASYKELGYSYGDETEGSDTLVIRRGNRYYFQNALDSDEVCAEVTFGKSTDEYLVGDWDGDGIDTICLHRGNKYYFQASPDSDEIWTVVSFGKSADEALAGDWDGDGADELAVRRGSTYYFQADACAGEILAKVVYGKSADEVLAGDWNGDGADELAVRRGNTYYFQNTYDSSATLDSVAFGKSTDAVFAGDWDGDGADTLGLQRGNVYRFQLSLTSDAALSSIRFGHSTDVGAAGIWK